MIKTDTIREDNKNDEQLVTVALKNENQSSNSSSYNSLVSSIALTSIIVTLLSLFSKGRTTLMKSNFSSSFGNTLRSLSIGSSIIAILACAYKMYSPALSSLPNTGSVDNDDSNKAQNLKHSSNFALNEEEVQINQSNDDQEEERQQETATVSRGQKRISRAERRRVKREQKRVEKQSKRNENYIQKKQKQQQRRLVDDDEFQIPPTTTRRTTAKKLFSEGENGKLMKMKQQLSASLDGDKEEEEDEYIDSEEQVWKELHYPCKNTHKQADTSAASPAAITSPTTSTCSSIDSKDEEEFEMMLNRNKTRSSSSSMMFASRTGSSSTSAKQKNHHHEVAVVNTDDESLSNHQQYYYSCEEDDEEESEETVMYYYYEEEEEQNEEEECVIEEVEDDSLPIFIMTLGVPGSGKSFFTERLQRLLHEKYEGSRDTAVSSAASSKPLPLRHQMKPMMNIIQSDLVRTEVTGNINDQTQNEAVWAEILLRAQSSLSKGVDTLLDATNVDTVRRRTFLNQLPPCRLRLKTFFIKEHSARNRIAKDLKEGKDRSRVPDRVLSSMMKKFKESLAMSPSEGWKPFVEEEYFESLLFVVDVAHQDEDKDEEEKNKE